MSILKSKLQLAVSVIFLALLVWWLSFQSVVEKQGLSVQWFGGTYGLMALLGSIIGFVAMSRWGGLKTVLGKALFFFSLGLFAQEVGQLILTYYIYGSKIQIPYPSWGDVAYMSSTISYLIGALFLNKAIGTQFSLKKRSYKLIAIVVPLIILAISSAVFLYHHQFDTKHPLTVVLDLAYPIGDAAYISLGLVAFLLSRKLLGGLMRGAMLVLMLGLAVQYAADFTFLYQSDRGTYLSGKYDDLLYCVAYFITTSAMIRFLSIHSHLRSKVAKPVTSAPPAEEVA